MCTVPVWGLDRQIGEGESPRHNGRADVVAHEFFSVVESTVGDRMATHRANGGPPKHDGEEATLEHSVAVLDVTNDGSLASLAAINVADRSANGLEICVDHCVQDSETKQATRAIDDVEHLIPHLDVASDEAIRSTAVELHDLALKKRSSDTCMLFLCAQALTHRRDNAKKNNKKKIGPILDEVNSMRRCVLDLPNRSSTIPALAAHLCSLCQSRPPLSPEVSDSEESEEATEWDEWVDSSVQEEWDEVTDDI